MIVRHPQRCRAAEDYEHQNDAGECTPGKPGCQLAREAEVPVAQKQNEGDEEGGQQRDEDRDALPLHRPEHGERSGDIEQHQLAPQLDAPPASSRAERRPCRQPSADRRHPPAGFTLRSTSRAKPVSAELTLRLSASSRQPRWCGGPCASPWSLRSSSSSSAASGADLRTDGGHAGSCPSA